MSRLNPALSCAAGRPASHRRSAVGLSCSTTKQALLLHTHDIDDSKLGSWWELPGGGLEPGEAYLAPRSGTPRGSWNDCRTLEVGPPNWRPGVVQAPAVTACARRGDRDPALAGAQAAHRRAHCAWITKRRTTSASAGGRHRRSAQLASVSTPASCPRCSTPSSTARNR